MAEYRHAPTVPLSPADQADRLLGALQRVKLATKQLIVQQIGTEKLVEMASFGGKTAALDEYARSFSSEGWDIEMNFRIRMPPKGNFTIDCEVSLACPAGELEHDAFRLLKERRQLKRRLLTSYKHVHEYYAILAQLQASPDSTFCLLNPRCCELKWHRGQCRIVNSPPDPCSECGAPWCPHDIYDVPCAVKPVEDDEEPCDKCGVVFGCSKNAIVLCDGPQCTGRWHQFCLEPPMRQLPEGDWLCPSCAGKGYGQPSSIHPTGDGQHVGFADSMHSTEDEDGSETETCGPCTPRKRILTEFDAQIAEALVSTLKREMGEARMEAKALGNPAHYKGFRAHGWLVEIIGGSRMVLHPPTCELERQALSIMRAECNFEREALNNYQEVRYFYSILADLRARNKDESPSRGPCDLSWGCYMAAGHEGPCGIVGSSSPTVDEEQDGSAEAATSLVMELRLVSKAAELEVEACQKKVEAAKIALRAAMIAKDAATAAVRRAEEAHNVMTISPWLHEVSKRLQSS